MSIPGKAADQVPSTWVSKNHVGDPDGFLGFCVWPGSDPTVVSIWGVNGPVSVSHHSSFK